LLIEEKLLVLKSSCFSRLKAAGATFERTYSFNGPKCVDNSGGESIWAPESRAMVERAWNSWIQWLKSSMKSAPPPVEEVSLFT
jgi:Fic family protein